MALKDVIGHDKAINILLRTIEKGKIPSAYLFSGESGIGKKFTALNFAKALNCISEKRTNNYNLFYDACDECPSCQKIEKGVHPDFLMIESEGNQIKIEEIRAIEEKLSLKAYEGQYKIVIIDNAENMNQSAANAFLKTLEEPSENSLIILVSSMSELLPDTIRSRCCKVNFAPLSSDECLKVIKNVIGNKYNSKKIPSKTSRTKNAYSRLHEIDILEIISKLSMGKPGYAVTVNLIEERKWFIDLLEDMMNAEKDGWSSREEMERWFELLLVLLRDMALLKVKEDGNYMINIDLKEYIEKLSRTMSLKVIIEIYQQMSRLKGYLRYNLNKSLTWNFTGSLLRTRMDINNA